MMTNNRCELVQHCIKTRQYFTIKIYNCYFLFHRNIIQCSNNRELRLELPPVIIKKIFGSNPLTVIDVTSTCHVDPSLYDIIIFADKSVIYTRTKPLFDDNTDESLPRIKKQKVLPYYVHADLELLKSCGMSQNDIDLFVRKLDDDKINIFVSNKHDQILQKIIDLTDISTRLNCRLVSKKWKTCVDQSSSWRYVRLFKLNQYIDRALRYFQKINIHELDLSQSVFKPCNSELTTHVLLLSLRSLCISTDHSLEVFNLIFQIAPFLKYVKLIQTVDSQLKIKHDYIIEHIKCIIRLCQTNLKCLHRLHIQLLSASDQTFLESSSFNSIPISYEVIKC